MNLAAKEKKAIVTNEKQNKVLWNLVPKKKKKCTDVYYHMQSLWNTFIAVRTMQ